MLPRISGVPPVRCEVTSVLGCILLQAAAAAHGRARRTKPGGQGDPLAAKRRVAAGAHYSEAMAAGARSRLRKDEQFKFAARADSRQRCQRANGVAPDDETADAVAYRARCVPRRRRLRAGSLRFVRLLLNNTRQGVSCQFSLFLVTYF